jgi:cation transport regulator ChaB
LFSPNNLRAPLKNSKDYSQCQKPRTTVVLVRNQDLFRGSNSQPEKHFALQRITSQWHPQICSTALYKRTARTTSHIQIKQKSNSEYLSSLICPVSQLMQTAQVIYRSNKNQTMQCYQDHEQYRSNKIKLCSANRIIYRFEVNYSQ